MVMPVEFCDENAHRILKGSGTESHAFIFNGEVTSDITLDSDKNDVNILCLSSPKIS